MPRFVATLLALLVVASAHAQEVEVASVRFNRLQAPGGASGNWLEVDVTLSVRPGPGSIGQMVARVHVALLAGFESPAPPGGERRLEHYRAEAECVALETGRANVRFYLPPELVKRDQLHGEPKFWGVELRVGDHPVPAGRAAYSSSLPTAEHRRNFQARGGPAAARNDGILLPQYLTIFASKYPRATPSFVRRER